MQSEGSAFIGSALATIDSPDARRAGAKGVYIKLVTHEDNLGRFVAEAGPFNDPHAALPYVVSLNKVSSGL